MFFSGGGNSRKKHSGDIILNPASKLRKLYKGEGECSRRPKGGSEIREIINLQFHSRPLGTQYHKDQLLTIYQSLQITLPHPIKLPAVTHVLCLLATQKMMS